MSRPSKRFIAFGESIFWLFNPNLQSFSLQNEAYFKMVKLCIIDSVVLFETY
jgi:hypothetical protein